MTIQWRPTMCEDCGKRPAVISYQDGEPDACEHCVSPCGDDCCGMDYCEGSYVISELWRMARGKRSSPRRLCER